MTKTLSTTNTSQNFETLHALSLSLITVQSNRLQTKHFATFIYFGNRNNASCIIFAFCQIHSGAASHDETLQRMQANLFVSFQFFEMNLSDSFFSFIILIIEKAAKPRQTNKKR